MWAARFFAPRYFAGRYWAHEGETFVLSPSAILYARSRALTIDARDRSLILNARPNP